jgi:2-polyprenyl-6-hydroxyphenyl methylase/3-demethylubiquinone-9 3-methyltransferase
VSAPPAADFAAARRLYAGEPLGTRLFVLARRMLAPLPAIAARVPPAGAILDVGCGHGLFSLALAAVEPHRRIVGIDPSPAKISVAARACRALHNVEFREGVVESIQGESFSAIVVLDVLYLLPDSRKKSLLDACRRLLAPGGALVLKTNDTHPAWKYFIARTQERLMTGAGLTLGTGELHFRSCAENAALLRAAGFAAEIHHLAHWTPYPHTLFVARPV